MLTKLNLKFIGAYSDNNGDILYGVENGIGERRYFYHRAIRFSKGDDIDLVPITNDVIVKVLVQSHNQMMSYNIHSMHIAERYNGVFADELLILIPVGHDLDIKKWSDVTHPCDNIMKFNRVITDNIRVLYEFEYSNGDKKYFVHSNDNTSYPFGDITEITNKDVIRELIRIHNEYMENWLLNNNDGIAIEVDGIMIKIG